MKWYEVTLVSTHEGADLFADALFSVGCGGVSIFDKQDIVALYDSDIVSGKAPYFSMNFRVASFALST